MGKNPSSKKIGHWNIRHQQAGAKGRNTSVGTLITDDAGNLIEVRARRVPTGEFDAANRPIMGPDVLPTKEQILAVPGFVDSKALPSPQPVDSTAPVTQVPDEGQHSGDALAIPPHEGDAFVDQPPAETAAPAAPAAEPVDPNSPEAKAAVKAAVPEAHVGEDGGARTAEVALEQPSHIVGGPGLGGGPLDTEQL